MSDARLELRATSDEKQAWVAAAQRDGNRSLNSWIRAVCNQALQGGAYWIYCAEETPPPLVRVPCAFQPRGGGRPYMLLGSIGPDGKWASALAEIPLNLSRGRSMPGYRQSCQSYPGGR